LIVGPDTPREQIYLVMRGSVRLFHRGPDGRELTVDLLGRGRLFGLSALFGLVGEGLLAEAATDALICLADTATFLSLLARWPRVKLLLAQHLGTRLLHLERQLARLTAADARTRLASVLWHLAREVGETLPGGERQIARPPTHADLARQIGSSRETVTRLLAALEADGHLRRAGRGLILDVQRLSDAFQLDNPA
jgi:CRP/FNR family transcriptional regulator